MITKQKYISKTSIALMLLGLMPFIASIYYFHDSRTTLIFPIGALVSVDHMVVFEKKHKITRTAISDPKNREFNMSKDIQKSADFKSLSSFSFAIAIESQRISQFTGSKVGFLKKTLP